MLTRNSQEYRVRSAVLRDFLVIVVTVQVSAVCGPGEHFQDILGVVGIGEGLASTVGTDCRYMAGLY